MICTSGLMMIGVLALLGSVSSLVLRVRGALHITEKYGYKISEVENCRLGYLLVLGRSLFPLFGLVPSNTFIAARSSGEICLNTAFVFLIGDVRDFIFSFSMSRRIFSFRRRRSSSFQSRIRRGRHGLLSARTNNLKITRKRKKKQNIHHHLADSRSIQTTNNAFRFSLHQILIRSYFSLFAWVSRYAWLVVGPSEMPSWLRRCFSCNSFLMSCCSPNV